MGWIGMNHLKGWKGMNHLKAMGWIVPLLFFYKDSFGIK